LFEGKVNCVANVQTIYIISSSLGLQEDTSLPKRQNNMVRVLLLAFCNMECQLFAVCKNTSYYWSYKTRKRLRNGKRPKRYSTHLQPFAEERAQDKQASNDTSNATLIARLSLSLSPRSWCQSAPFFFFLFSPLRIN
jgi:hypothetical protein